MIGLTRAGPTEPVLRDQFFGRKQGPRKIIFHATIWRRNTYYGTYYSTYNSALYLVLYVQLQYNTSYIRSMPSLLSVWWRQNTYYGTYYRGHTTTVHKTIRCTWYCTYNCSTEYLSYYNTRYVVLRAGASYKILL